MKKLIIAGMGICAFIFSAFLPVPAGTVAAPTTTREDSVISVISYFCKHDTLVYWISEGEWKVNGTDTVKTSGASTQVMLTVVNSTKKRYTMEYRFLAFESDTSVHSSREDFVRLVIGKLGSKLVGTTIRFRTDKYGRITKYENLPQIKKQAQAVFSELGEELMRLPVMDTLRTIGLDIASYMKKVDADELLQGYVKELELLFQNHGYVYPLGKTTEHEEATPKRYASDSYFIADYDAETEEYGLISNVDCYLPQGDMKELTLALLALFPGNEQQMAELGEEWDKQVAGDVVRNTYYRIRYFANGWPMEVVSQTNTLMGKYGKLKQTYIVWDYRSTGNTK